MEPIDPQRVEGALAAWRGVDVYLHLETTHGAYTKNGFGAFARNVRIRFEQAAVRGHGPFRVGLRLENGWVYAEGLTHWQPEDGGVQLAGHDEEGRLTVVLQLSREPRPTTVQVGLPVAIKLEPQAAPSAAGNGAPGKTPAPSTGAGTGTGATGGRPTAEGDGPHREGATQPGPQEVVPAPDERHLVVILAHPDDEAFSSAGTMALAVRQGVPVTHVCVTTGQMGRRVGHPPKATRESLAAIRTRELQQALSILGVRDLRMLNLWDKTVEFLDRGELARQLAAILSETGASTVITFHPELGGHPDHCAVGAATVAAVRMLPRHRRPRVLFPVGPAADRDLGWTMLKVPIGQVSALKEAALRAHWSQTSGWDQQLANNPEMRQRLAQWMEQERFWLYPLEGDDDL